MDERVLFSLGLTKSEIKVYKSLFDLGQCTVTPIIKKTLLYKPAVYSALDRLLEKGLISYVLINNKKHFQLTYPAELFSRLEEKKKEIEKMEKSLKEELPKILEKKAKAIYSNAQIYKGASGIRSVLGKILEELVSLGVKEFYGIGVPGSENKTIEAIILQFHNQRTRNEITYKAIYNFEAEERIKKRKRIPLTKIRVLPKSLATPGFITIAANKIYLWDVTTKDSENTVIEVENERILKSFKTYFNILWKNSKPVK